MSGCVNTPRVIKQWEPFSSATQKIHWDRISPAQPLPNPLAIIIRDFHRKALAGETPAVPVMGCLILAKGVTKG